MAKILSGGCLCGTVRYEYDGRPGKSSYCHCDDCKRATGGPYTVGVLSKADKLRIVSGNSKAYYGLVDDRLGHPIDLVRAQTRVTMT